MTKTAVISHPARRKSPAVAVQRSPWGRQNPNRGLLHLEKARSFLSRFGLTGEGEVILRKDIDTYLIDNGHMPVDATHRERYTYRRKFLQQLRSASISPHMRNVGLEPFDVDFQRKGWRIEPLREAARRSKPAKKLFSQARTSSRQQRHIMQSLDPVHDQKAYLVATVGYEVTNMHEELAKALRPIMDQAQERIGAVIDYTEQLRLNLPDMKASA
jgi:hypothetical protein